MQARLPVLFLVLTVAACRSSEVKTDAANERGFVVTEIKPSAGDLPAVLQAEAAKAKARGLRPHVELWATWCGPCAAIKKSLDDPRMKAAFKGTYIVQLDIDAWGKKLPAAGFASKSIPIFFAIDDAGKSTGRKIGGEAWKEDVPENMAPPLDRFFHGT
jgi:thiol-disulfide isomerase/thioredoxin